MITFLQKNEDTATIRVVSCEQSRICAAVNGGDVTSIDSLINDVNSDDNIKHINLSLTYFNDEAKVLDFINKINLAKAQNALLNGGKINGQQKEDRTSQAPKKSTKQRDKQDWTCPECHGNDCLIDKYGNKYPCLSCIQIDIGQKLMQKFGKEFNLSIDKNNKLMSILINGLRDNVDSSYSYPTTGKGEYQNGESN